VLQFIWWGYHLIELTKELDDTEQFLSKRVTMIIGEGLVFFLLLIAGLWKIQSSIRKELKLAERQKNFLLSVTHELKTPLAANKLFWQTLEKRELSIEQRKDLIGRALQENERLEYLIDNILDASRIENKALQIIRERILVSQLMNELLEKFSKKYPEYRFKGNIEPDIYLRSDRSLLETIIRNLIENATKYGDKAGEITLYLKCAQGSVRMGVQDTGKGVENEQKGLIFSKFYRSGNEETRSQKGTGLGLFIASEFTRLLGGIIVCKDNVPSGADFEITFNHE
jgi:signal transduction histidine kinase